MLVNMRIDEFVNKCGALDSQMNIVLTPVAPSIVFSNTGRRGLKHFSISLVQLKGLLVDVLDALDLFAGNQGYDETIWRDMFSKSITDEVVNALSGVQTLPLFAVINKVLTVANGLDDRYTDKSMPLSQAHLEKAIEYIDSQIPDNDDYLISLDTDVVKEPPRAAYDLGKKAKNIIFYGAPGTGKSYSISKEVDERNTIRTVFHPDTQYSDFVGCLRPVMNGGDVGYGFRPGPFTQAIIKAVNDPTGLFSLVIEEINRASAAAVFGDIFQLLDRTADGSSEYAIDIADPDLLAYLNESTEDKFEDGKLRIPANLSLLASMNSSDQAVMPMDTAFKRRWEFRYLPIDYAKASKGKLTIPLSEGRVSVEWATFARIINNVLSEQRISEDRLLGHRFVSEEELKNSGSNVLTGKLFAYLWDDVLRHGQKGVIFTDSTESGPLATYGDLITAFDSGRPVFNDRIDGELLEQSRLSDESGETGAAEAQLGE